MANDPGDLLSGALKVRTLVLADGETDLTRETRGISISSNGTLSLKLADESTFTAVYLLGGVIHPLRVKNIQLTGSTAGLTVLGYN